ncbi:putative DNA-binding transcriptional regulator [Kluyvera cryocrescens]|uniref:Putative DNA-binding transcriptional regulator n=1 Tax=Kluyvera cryocrescens TaxID=580 RepID=A0A485CKR1_KLUCR|nr:putative DNA-binding transcriptional regulator [Kluyvera cryocrescens]
MNTTILALWVVMHCLAINWYWVCRDDHPAHSAEPSVDTLMQYEHTLLTMDGAGQNDLYKRIRDMLPDRQV